MDKQTPGSGLAFLRERFAMFREPARYMTQSSEIADLVGTVPAKFNRLIFYTGDSPHSAYITDPTLLSEDVDRGRLTLNRFASVWPRS